MTAITPDVDLTLETFYKELEKEVLDIPCEAGEEVHADEFVTATWLWRLHCKDVALCEDCHQRNCDSVAAGFTAAFLCGFCGAQGPCAGHVVFPLGPIR